MKILSLTVENFKNILNATIDFKNNLSGIYGPNGTGKTAVIEALEIITLYFTPKKSKEYGDELKNKIRKSINVNSSTMGIEVIFEDNEYFYKLKLSFQKDNLNSENIFATAEELWIKEIAKKNNKFRNIVLVNNSSETIMPQLYFKEKYEYQTEIEKLLQSKAITKKSLYLEFDKLNSYLSLINSEITAESKNILTKEIQIFNEHWNKIEKTIMTMFVITLKEQALYNLEIVLPLKAHLDNSHGTLPINIGKDRGNIYDEKIVEYLERVVEQIGDIFSVIIPDSQLKLEKKDVKIEENTKKVAVNLYIIKNGNKIAVENESTGIIKLISLLSALIYYVQDENAIVLIDELDIHIFEYLLATLLEKLSKFAKGQLIFTAHNLLPMEKLNRNSIIISTCEDGNTSYVYFKGTSGTTNFRQKYLRSQNMWSETNIAPLLLNESALELYLKNLVI